VRLSDVVSHSGLSFYAEVALVLFLIAFVAIAIWIFRPGRRSEMDHMSRLPLDDGASASLDGASSSDQAYHGAPAPRRTNR